MKRIDCVDLHLRLWGKAVHLLLEPGVHGVGGAHLTEDVVEVTMARLHDYQLLIVKVELSKVSLHVVSI